MILVDTSVWIDHLREGDQQLSDLLNRGHVLVHPSIIGELACGNLKNRQQILKLLKNLPTVMEASHQEVLYFIENNKLMGKGIGYVDVHLLAATALSHPAKIWTRDRRLNDLAEKLGLNYIH